RRNLAFLRVHRKSLLETVAFRRRRKRAPVSSTLHECWGPRSWSPTSRSWQKQHLAGYALLDGRMPLGGVLEWQPAVDWNDELAGADGLGHVPQPAGVLLRDEGHEANGREILGIVRRTSDGSIDAALFHLAE